MGQPENDGKMTGVLLFSITISCLSNPFLYGYQIGVINQPAELVKVFYNKTYYERAGGMWENMTNYEEYMMKNMTDAAAMIHYGIKDLGAAVVVAGGSGTPAASTNASYTNDAPVKSLTPEHFGADLSFLLETWELELMWSTTVAAFVLFGMIGAFISAKVADFFGRKRGMILITVLMFFAAVLGGITLMVSSPECLILSRCVVGLHSGLCITLCPLYLSEISPKKIRGAIGTCFQLFITIGILVAQVFGIKELLGTTTLWPWLFAFNAIPAALGLIALPFCPESPRFLLIKKGEEEEARDALVKFRGTENVSDEMEDMRLEASKSSSVANYSIKELLSAPDLRMPVIIACTLQICQQWSGINAVFSYSTMLFKMVAIPEEQIPYVVLGTGAINVLLTVVAVPLMEKLGRRPLLIYPTILMLVSFVIMTIALNLGANPDYAEHKGTLAMLCIIVMHTYIVGFALGLGPIPFIVVAEIFRQEPRAAAMSLSLVCNWVCNFTLMLTFPFLKEGLEEFVYVLFMVVITIAIVFIYFFVPETKNKTFDEISGLIKMGGRAKGPSQAYGVDEQTPMDTTKV